jgi:hypothetical protein
LSADIAIGFTLVTVFIPVVVMVGFVCKVLTGKVLTGKVATGKAAVGAASGFVIVNTKVSGGSSRFN